jgi:tetratricopeptide (TPR) repeat protein
MPVCSQVFSSGEFQPPRDALRGIRREVYSCNVTLVRSLRMWTFAAAVLAFMIGEVGSARGQQVRKVDLDPPSQEHFRIARQAQLRNDLDTAVSEYKQVLSRNPKCAQALLNLGIVYHQQRRFQQAVEVLNSAVSLAPDMPGGQVFLGIDRYLTKDFKGAVGPLTRALQLKPADRQAAMYLGLTYLALNQPDKAVAVLHRAVAGSPADLELLYQLAEAYLETVRQSSAFLAEEKDKSGLYHWGLAFAAEEKQDRLVAIKESLRALALDPRIAELYWNLTAQLQAVGMHDLASAALQRYRILNPLRDLTQVNSDQYSETTPFDRAITLEHKNEIQRLWQAVPIVNSVVSLPAVSDEYVNEAITKRLAASGMNDLRAAVRSYMRGDYRTAALQIRSRVREQPQDWVSAYLLARSYFLASDYNAARAVVADRLVPYLHLPSVSFLRVQVYSQVAQQCLTALLEKDPDSLYAKLVLATSYDVAGKYPEALATYQEALRIAPNRLGLHLAIGRLYAMHLHWADAAEEYKKELALDPDNAMALAQLGHAATEARDPDQAIPALNQVLRMYPKDGKAYGDLAKAWALKGDAPRAIAAYERALLYDPTQYSIHYRLFELYTKTGDTAQAQNHLNMFKAAAAREHTKSGPTNR